LILATGTLPYVFWFEYRRVQRLRLPIKGLKFWRFDNTISEFWAYFSLHMRRNAHLRASGQKSDLAIRFGDPYFLQQGNNSSVGIHFRYVLAISLVRMRSNSVNPASGRVQQPRFLIKGLKLWRFDNTISEF